MMPSARVHLLPGLATAADFTGKTAVVIDILRASTTIVHALAAGAKGVRTFLNVDEARTAAEQLGEEARLGGERGGNRIPGFHFGNSPAEYTADSIGQRTLLFTTTNGTRALELCREAKRITVGAFVNFSAVCRDLADEPAIELLCAGTDGCITREDVLFAGAVIDDLRRSRSLELNDQAEIAADAWRSAVTDFAAGKPLAEHFRATLGGRNLLEIGHERDLAIAAEIDRFDLVAEYDVSSGMIVRGRHAPS